MTEEEVSFQNKKGEKLSAIYHKPYGEPKKRAVIECHGFLASKNWSWIKDICDTVSKEGFTVLRFDFSGNGKSEGKWEEGTYSKQIDEVKSAMDYMQTKNYDEFILIGHSMGGAVITITASQDERVKMIKPVSAPADPRSMGERWFGEKKKEILEKGEAEILLDFGSVHIKKKVTSEWLRDLGNYDVTEAINKLNIPVYIIHGDEDETVSLRDGEAIFNAANEPKFLEVIKPQIHAKGSDYKINKIVEKDIVEKNGGKIILIPEIKGYSTTDFIKKIVDLYKD